MIRPEVALGLRLTFWAASKISMTQTRICHRINQIYIGGVRVYMSMIIALLSKG